MPRAGESVLETDPSSTTRDRVGALHGPDRPAVVAELGVVVVLQDQAVDPAGPGEQGGAALGREHHPGRELVGGHDDRAHRRVGVEVADPQPVAVDAGRHDPQPGPGGGLGSLCQPGSSTATAVMPAGPQAWRRGWSRR